MSSTRLPARSLHCVSSPLQLHAQSESLRRELYNVVHERGLALESPAGLLSLYTRLLSADVSGPMPNLRSRSDSLSAPSPSVVATAAVAAHAAAVHPANSSSGPDTAAGRGDEADVVGTPRGRMVSTLEPPVDEPVRVISALAHMSSVLSSIQLPRRQNRVRLRLEAPKWASLGNKDVQEGPSLSPGMEVAATEATPMQETYTGSPEGTGRSLSKAPKELQRLDERVFRENGQDLLACPFWEMEGEGPPQVIVPSTSIRQGNTGDCWLVAAMNALAQSPRFLRLRDGKPPPASGGTGGGRSGSAGSIPASADDCNFVVLPDQVVPDSDVFTARVCLLDILADSCNENLVVDPMQPKLITLTVNNVRVLRVCGCGSVAGVVVCSVCVCAVGVHVRGYACVRVMCGCACVSVCAVGVRVFAGVRACLCRVCGCVVGVRFCGGCGVVRVRGEWGMQV
jgi:hypothetical protein